MVLTAYDDDEQVFHAMRAGAHAYFPKDVTPEKLVEAVREVSAGRYVIKDQVMDDAQLAPWLLKQSERFGIVEGEWGDEAFVPLSPREMEILQHITRGLNEPACRKCTCRTASIAEFALLASSGQER